MSRIQELLEGMLDGEWWDLFTNPYTSTMGEASVALVLVGVTAAAILGWSGSMTLTAVWLVLSAGFFIALLPAPAATVVAVVVTLMLAVAYFAVAWTRIGGR